MEISLKELGFHKNLIIEVLLSVFETDGSPHIAPLGTSLYDNNTVIVKPFAHTKVYKILKTQREATLNVTSDPLLFFKSVFNKFCPEDFEDAKRIHAPNLIHADGHIETKVVRIVPGARPIFFLKVVDISVKRRLPRAYCRAHSAIVESLIHLSRIGVYKESRQPDKVKEAINLIEHYKSTIGRVAPNTIYEECIMKIHREALRKCRCSGES